MDRTPDPDDREGLDEALGLLPEEEVLAKRAEVLAAYGDVSTEKREDV